jgi:hypothetical protein
MEETNTVIFDFIKNPEKMKLLNVFIEKLIVEKKKIVFVYSAPKVGSTSIISSLRLYGIENLHIIHIHDEEMLYALTQIKGITINEIILYCKYLGKEVYVIDVYREPIERKISAYFEKIGAYHFNNDDEKVNTYNVEKVIHRFNRILPHIANGDHFTDIFNIPIPSQFDFVNKYLLVENNGIKYIKLRLRDSNIWEKILSDIFGFKIGIVKDYESANKPIKDLYSSFKLNYKIPKNLLDDIMKCKYLNYFLSSSEKHEYYQKWFTNSSNYFTAFTPEQYALYDELTMENVHLDYIQLSSNHYMDEGCICKACSSKRESIIKKIDNGEVLTIRDKVYHSEAKNELLSNRVKSLNKMNNVIPNRLKGRKNFTQEMSNIVKGRR